MSGVIRISLPAQLASRETACRSVSRVCKLSHGAAGSHDVQAVLRFTHELVSAVAESFNNVVLHAYGNLGTGTVDLALHWNSEQVVVEMRDTGKSFDLHAVPTPNLATPQERGMGLFIIRSSVDDVQYRPGSPNVLVLTKRIVARRAAASGAGWRNERFPAVG